MLEGIRDLYAYSAWANARILETAEQLTPEQFTSRVRRLRLDSGHPRAHGVRPVVVAGTVARNLTARAVGPGRLSRRRSASDPLGRGRGGDISVHRDVA